MTHATKEHGALIDALTGMLARHELPEPLPDNPMPLLLEWFEDARHNERYDDFNAMTLATAMTMYADNDSREFLPTARMPSMPMNGTSAAPFQMSGMYLLAPYLGVDITLPRNSAPDDIQRFVQAMEVCKCPTDHSQNWDSMMMPRLASCGMNAYLTPHHPPHWGVTASQISFPSRCVLSAELTEEMGMDHCMPMYWGAPPGDAIGEGSHGQLKAHRRGFLQNPRRRRKDGWDDPEILPVHPLTEACS